ncbi:MAG: OmpA family protein [Bdellovibrionales bacterium]
MSPILNRLFLSSTLMFFGTAIVFTGPIGCASAPKVNLDASTSPNEEITRIEGDIKSGFTNHYDILATSDFSSAQERLERAKSQMASNSKTETILATLGQAQGYLNRAKEKADSLQERAKGILEARSAALAAGARDFPRERENLKIQDDKLRAEVDRIANGKTSPERWADLQKGYLDLELVSIQDKLLSEPQAKVYSAVKNGAKKNTPNMLAQAERDLQNARNVIAANRHDNSAIEPAIEKAKQSSQLLVEVLSATKRPEGVVNEDAARTLVMQGRKLRGVSSELSEVSSEVAQKNAALKGASAAISLDKALESARKEFSSDEADVYRQGDKLLIRLKAVNFQSGRADLPSEALPLLTKVKTIAEELNPLQIVVEGHTDSTGKPQTNKILSQNRAEAVATFLSASGIDKDKINAVGAGYEKPLSSNKSKAGRAQNRRVDVIITPTAPNGSGTNM